MYFIHFKEFCRGILAASAPGNVSGEDLQIFYFWSRKSIKSLDLTASGRSSARACHAGDALVVSDQRRPSGSRINVISRCFLRTFHVLLKFL